MITIYPDNYLAGPAIAVIAVITVVVSCFLTQRWDWKAIPSVILAGVIVPVVLVLVAMAALELLPDNKVIGFFAASSDLLGLGLLSALVSFAGTMVLSRIRRRGKS